MTQMEAASEKRYEGEISLVDLVSTFLRRRRVFYVVFAIFLTVGLTYAILAPAKFEFVSLVKLAEREHGVYIRTPSAVIAEIENHWLPGLRSQFRAKNNGNLPFHVVVTNPGETGLIRLSSEAAASEAAMVEEAHAALIDGLREQQEADVQGLRDKLEMQMESLDATVELLKSAQDSGSSLAAAVEQRVSLEAKLSSVKAMEALVVGRQDAEPRGPSKSLVVVLAAILGAIAGIFLAFFMEFVSLVREKMAES